MTSVGVSCVSNQDGYIPGKPRGVTTLTFSRDWLIHIANQTLDISRRGNYVNYLGEKVDVSEALKYAIDNSVHYHSSHKFFPSKVENPVDTRFYVWYGSSLDVATKLQELSPDAHVAILNSASGKHPGGKFFRGTISQEDCICRASLLYPCLVQYADRPHFFYAVNNKPKYLQSNSTCAIFNPLVPVVREDTVRGDLLDTFSKFSFISIPAPNAFVLGSHPVPKAQEPGAGERNEAIELLTLEEDMHDRCYRTLSIMAEHGCTDLVLCAFGCGVHGNDPVAVANAMREILNSDEFRGRFRTIAFAIQPSRHSNYKAFIEAFPEARRS
ncbi:DUF2263-containing protein [Fragilaria crotonensis]|nr:DUF2263-containing protein [Fragilaria crotonensis]